VKYGKFVKYLTNIEDISSWGPTDYHSWATEYYECDIDLSAIEKIFNGEFSEGIAKALNPEIEMSGLLSELPEIGINS
jgi:hypothetical protein